MCISFVFSKFQTSTKLETLVQNLLEISKDVMKSKSLVFSQYTKFLDIIEWRAEKAGLQVLKLVGSMALKQRQTYIRKNLKNDPNAHSNLNLMKKDMLFFFL